MSRSEILRLRFDAHELHCEDLGCYQSRGIALTQLFRDAFARLPEDCKARFQPTVLECYAGDHSPHAWSFASARPALETLPCHVFHAWPEVGIQGYDEVCDELAQRGADAPQHDQLFWIGNAGTHASRAQLVQQFGQHPDMLLIDSGQWVSDQVKTTKRYVSLQDHTHYRFLLDVRGHGYSGRTKLLLNSRRPVFYQDRDCHEYWFWDLQPFVHYIPVASDFSDLAETLAWARAHPAACERIAQQAQAFHSQHLRRTHAVDRCMALLIRWGLPSAFTPKPQPFKAWRHRWLKA
jgi:hypothetical protein